MPRVAGLSATMLVLPMPCRPRARTVARLRAMWLIVLLVWVTRSLPAIGGLHRGAGWPEMRLVSRTPRRALSSSAECRLRRASIVARTTLTGLVEPRLRQDVAHAGGLDDRAHRAAGDDAGALARRA